MHLHNNIEEMPLKRGPKTRSHCCKVSTSMHYYVPSFEDFFEEADDADDYFQLLVVIPSGRVGGIMCQEEEAKDVV